MPLPEDNRYARRRARSRRVSAFAWLVLGVVCHMWMANEGMGQASAEGTALAKATTPSSVRMEDSLGVPFVEVPGTPVLFAVWETRVRDFAAFVRESGYTWDHAPDFSQSEDHPVVNVTLRDAIAFCNWLTARERKSGAITALQSYRLPTRREWDAAAGMASGRSEHPVTSELERDQRRFPWGMEWPPPTGAGNLNSREISGKDDGYTHTAPVGSFSPSAEGVYDLAGNVWEWTWDPDTHSESVGVLRGGSWMYFRKECLLSGYQYEVPAILRAPSVGFRCVFDDKRRAAELLAKAKDSASAKTAAGTSVAKATPEEVNKMREAMGRTGVPEAKPEAPGKGPEVAVVKPAKPGQRYTNSLGMMLQPLEGAPGLLVGTYEVRVRDFQMAMKALGKTWERRPTFAFEETHPVMNVSWKDAEEFCAWLTDKERKASLIGPGDRYRLPKDVEWSLAVGLVNETGDTAESRHLGNRVDYPWGTAADPPPKSANLDSARMAGGYEDRYSHTSPVGVFEPNRTGFHDLAGNVAEWCEDPWPGSPGERVIRGSSWLTSNPEAMLSSARQHFEETAARTDTGFRVVLEFQP